MSACSRSGSYQVAAVCSRPSQRRRARLLIVCSATFRSAQTRGQRLERLGVPRVLHLHVVVGGEDGVEGEALQAAPVHLRHRQPVAGDADEPHQALLPRLDGRLQGAVRAQRGVPLDDVDQVVQLDRVDPVDAEPVQRAADLLARAAVAPLPRLRREEERARVALQPGRDAQLGVAVARGDVDVVDPVLEQRRRARGPRRPWRRCRAPRRRRSPGWSRARSRRTAQSRSPGRA